ncbi:MAG: folate-binding protein YgfZ [Magnetococcales bacterium]|nr:folate-binding protein YgfZ [Magnetococcales bacterium]NGZ27427.1 folate-binding protein YgfZ [Magnetococcales bacterium]
MTTTPWEEKAVTTATDGLTPPDHFGHPAAERTAMQEKGVLLPFSPTVLIVVEGEDRVNFLSGLITNQIRKVTSSRAIYAGLLSAQGRFLYDFTIAEQGNSFVLLTDTKRAASLLDRLDMYRLRSKVSLQRVTTSHLLAMAGPQVDEIIYSLFPQVSGQTEPGTVWQLSPTTLLWRDPRLPAYGWRLLTDETELSGYYALLAPHLPLAGQQAWHDYRCQMALPQGGYEWQVDETLPLEGGFLELNGVDFTKGCYIGQETTARTHHRGTLRKRLFKLSMATPLTGVTLPAPLLLENGKEAGTLTTLASDGMSGLAIVRVSDVANGEPVFCQNVGMSTQQPTWATWQLN